jgi:hypothetical protein
MSKNRFKPNPKVVLGLAALSLIVLAGCARGAAPAPMPREVAVEEVVVEREVAVPAEAPAPPGVAHEAALADLGSTTERMIIRTADLAVVVEDTETALTQIRGVATAMNGYIANTNIWRADEQLRGTVTIRVPAESFDAAMDQIKDLAVEVERENVSGQDVTEEYTDLSARLRNLEATEEELLVLLTEVREKTRKAEDVLAVHRELTNIRGQIEQVKGRMQYLERLTALATINVELIPEEEKPIVEAGWQPLRTLREALRALVNTGQFLVDAAIWLVVFVLPVLLILLAPLVLVGFLWRRWRRRRAARKASSPEEDSTS